MEAVANEKFQSEIKKLEESAAEAQRKINELQSQKKDKDQRFILSPEQTAEESLAFFCLGLFRFVVLFHCVSPTWSIAIDRSFIVACCRRSGHGCPEPKDRDKLGKSRSGCGLPQRQSQRTPEGTFGTVTAADSS